VHQVEKNFPGFPKLIKKSSHFLGFEFTPPRTVTIFDRTRFEKKERKKTLK
jgi:hypothetical protein